MSINENMKISLQSAGFHIVTNLRETLPGRQEDTSSYD
jgi:hypothetical protein